MKNEAIGVEEIKEVKGTVGKIPFEEVTFRRNFSNTVKEEIHEFSEQNTCKSNVVISGIEEIESA